MPAEVKKLNSSMKPVTTTKVLPVQTTTKILPPIGVSSLQGVNLDQLVNMNSQNQTSTNYQNVQVYQTGVPSQNEFVQSIMNSPLQNNVVVTTQKQVKTNIIKKANVNNNPININTNVNNINNIESAEVKALRQSYKDEIKYSFPSTNIFDCNTFSMSPVDSSDTSNSFFKDNFDSSTLWALSKT